MQNAPRRWQMPANYGLASDYPGMPSLSPCVNPQCASTDSSSGNRSCLHEQHPPAGTCCTSCPTADRSWSPRFPRRTGWGPAVVSKQLAILRKVGIVIKPRGRLFEIAPQFHQRPDCCHRVRCIWSVRRLCDWTIILPKSPTALAAVETTKKGVKRFLGIPGDASNNQSSGKRALRRVGAALFGEDVHPNAVKGIRNRPERGKGRDGPNPRMVVTFTCGLGFFSCLCAENLPE